MNEVGEEAFYSLSSEYYLRRICPFEIPAQQFEKLLIQAEEVLGAIDS